MAGFPYADRLECIKAPQPISEADDARVRDTVATVRRDVAARGDAALREYTKQFDGIDVDELLVSDADIEAARVACDDELLDGMRFAIERVKAFAEAQLATMHPLEIEVLPGIHLGHRLIPLQKVGAYVPGGRYPLLSRR